MSDGQIAPAALGRHWSPDELKLRKLVGMSLAIGGNLLISGALNVQKAVHNRNERLGPEQRRPYTKMPLWWAGFLMTILGELGNFAAYGFAEASLVTPLGAVTVVSNAFFAAIVLREGLRARDVCGCLLVVVGSAIIAANASMHEEYLDPSLFVRYASAPPFLAFSAALLAAICAAYGLRHRYGHRHVAYYVTLCALIGSITVMAAKGLSSFFNAWAYGGSSPLAHPTAYLLALTLGGTAVLQVRFLNLAMQHFGNTETVPVFYVRARHTAAFRAPAPGGLRAANDPGPANDHRAPRPLLALSRSSSRSPRSAPPPYSTATSRTSPPSRSSPSSVAASSPSPASSSSPQIGNAKRRTRRAAQAQAARAATWRARASRSSARRTRGTRARGQPPRRASWPPRRAAGRCLRSRTAVSGPRTRPRARLRSAAATTAAPSPR